MPRSRPSACLHLLFERFQNCLSTFPMLVACDCQDRILLHKKLDASPNLQRRRARNLIAVIERYLPFLPLMSKREREQQPPVHGEFAEEALSEKQSESTEQD